MRLILIRHAMPVVVPDKPASHWELSEEGRSASLILADDLSNHGIATIMSSEEPKCRETAAAIAERLDLRWSTAANLHEHRRGVMNWQGDADWQRLLQRFFENPDDLVFGYETATVALRRFSRAIDDLVNQLAEGDGPLAIVTHGTVMSLFVAQKLQVDPFGFWRQLKLPDYFELDVDLQMEQVGVPDA